MVDYRSEYTGMDRQWWDRSLFVNQTLFNPEWIYGVSGTWALYRIFPSLHNAGLVKRHVLFSLGV